MFNYADNFLSLAARREEVVAITEALGVALERNPAGLLRLKSPRIRRVDHGFESLGYEFRRRVGIVTARPKRKKLQHVRERFWLKRIEHRCNGWGLSLPNLRHRIRSFRSRIRPRLASMGTGCIVLFSDWMR